MNGLGIAAIIVVVVLGLIVVIQMVLVTALLIVIKNLAQEIRERIDPLIDKTNALLITANEIGQTVQGKTESIGTQSVKTTEVVAGHVEKIAALLQYIVAAPLIGGAAWSSGVSQAVATWRQARARRRTPPSESSEV